MRPYRYKNAYITLVPENFEEAIWLADSRNFKRCKKCPPLERCLNCQEILDGEGLLESFKLHFKKIILVFLIIFKDAEEKKTLLKSMRSVKMRSLNDAFYIFDIGSTVYEPFVTSRIQYLQKKYQTNIEIHVKCREKGSKKFYVPAKKKFLSTLCLLIDSNPRTSKSLIEYFELINDRKKLYHEFICTVTKNCKYTTDIRCNYEKHKRICKKFNSQKVIYKQTPFGLKASLVQEMIDKDIIPWFAKDYRCDFIATFDCETIENRIEGPESFQGMTQKATLNLLSIAVGTNCQDLESKCWIRRTSEPDEEERLARVSQN